MTANSYTVDILQSKLELFSVKKSKKVTRATNCGGKILQLVKDTDWSE